MTRLRTSMLFATTFVVTAALAGDKAGCADHPLLPARMPGYVIERCEAKEFDAYAFPTGKTKTTVEGRFTVLTYAVEDRKQDASAVAVARNYENALAQAGGSTVFVEPNSRYIVGKIVKNGQEAWVHVEKGNGKIWLRVIEKQAMQQYVKADAASLGSGLGASGHVAVEGIYFDTGKSELKPESTPALQEVAKLLATDPGLKLWVVGHTDSVGALADNVKLSEDRARAVVAALTTTHGIAAARLAGHGCGPLAPVASNSSEEGRAKNRRVELVKQ